MYFTTRFLDDELGRDVVEDDDDDVRDYLNYDVVEMQDIHEYEHACQVDEARRQPASEERYHLLDNRLESLRLAVEHPLAVGDVGGQDGQEPCDDGTRHDRKAERMRCGPIRDDVHERRQDAEHAVWDDVLVLVVELSKIHVGENSHR